MSKAFPRGSENTVLIGERPQICQPANGDKVYNLWGLGFYSPYMPTFASLTPAGFPSSFSTMQAAPVEPLPKETDAGRAEDIRVRIGQANALSQSVDFSSPFQR